MKWQRMDQAQLGKGHTQLEKDHAQLRKGFDHHRNDRSAAEDTVFTCPVQVSSCCYRPPLS